MSNSPTTPTTEPVLTAALLLQELAMTHSVAVAEGDEPSHPYKPNDGELLDIEHVLRALLGWRRPAEPGEALAMVALAYEELECAQAFEGPMERESFERAYRLLRRALPVLARAIRTEGVTAAILDHFGHPALNDVAA